MKHSLAVTTIAVALGASAFSAGPQTNPPPATHKPEAVVARVRDDLIVRERVRQITEAQTKILPEDGRSFYDKNRDKFKLPERVRASHILIQVPKDATDEVKKQKRTQIESVQTLLKGGEKFAD